MTIEISQPELEALIQEHLKRGSFHDVDELLTQALYALRDQSDATAGPEPRNRLIDVLMEPPFAGSDLLIERQRDFPAPIDL